MDTRKYFRDASTVQIRDLTVFERRSLKPGKQVIILSANLLHLVSMERKRRKDWQSRILQY